MKSLYLFFENSIIIIVTILLASIWEKILLPYLDGTSSVEYVEPPLHLHSLERGECLNMTWLQLSSILLFVSDRFICFPKQMEHMPQSQDNIKYQLARKQQITLRLVQNSFF